MTDNTLKTNNTQQVEPELPPLTKEEEEMLLETAKNWKEPEYDDYDAYNTCEASCDVGFPPALKKKPSAEEYAKQIDKTGFEKKGLYKGIVQVEDDFRRIRLIKAYRERAKELGGTQMAKFFDEMLKTAKKEWMEGEKMGMKKKTMPASGTVLGRTNYTNLPEGMQNLDCAECWEATDQGIYFNGQGKYIKVCSQSVSITGILRSVESGEEIVKLEFRRNKKWKRIEVDRGILASPQKIIELYKQGFSVTSQNAKAIVAFLQDMLDRGIENGTIPVSLVTSKMGWTEDKSAFIPYTDEKIMFNDQGKFSKLPKALEPKGDSELWYEVMKKERDIEMVQLLLAANLAAPVVGLLGLEGFTVNLHGQSRGGKSVTSKLCASVWAGHESRDGFVYGVNNTLNSLDEILGTYNTLPFIMEDANNMDKKRKVDMSSVVMKTANGVGKARMGRDLKLKPVQTWYLVGITTSEFRLLKDGDNGGAYNRLVMVKAPDEEDCPYKENAAELLDFAENNHGFCGRDFVKVLQKLGKDAVAEMLQGVKREVDEKAKEAGKSGGQVLPIAVLVLTSRLAEEHLFHDGKVISVEDAVRWMTDKDLADQNERFYETLMDTVMTNGSKFEGLGMNTDFPPQNYWGRYDSATNKIGIIPSVLRKLAEEAGVDDVKAFLEYLDGKGMIDKDKNGNLTKNVYSSCLAKGNRMHVIQMKKADKDSCDASFGNGDCPFGN